jgi:hypothetical protein
MNKASGVHEHNFHEFLHESQKLWPEIPRKKQEIPRKKQEITGRPSEGSWIMRKSGNHELRAL